ncbi:acyl-CoA synthetase FdrA [Bacillus sp. S/N-304-OC-R1]|uniref:acyl-CoA synthetase FdrA n=1 Tax=Bacillus sp. S/N-304-OC-R1 TaxID=2758034 RepID=UPI001C8EEBC5|nr:acyl-CoA synthetase FdrA [Bacillus sp. S/N-304-OC-R1]MBY0121242.1 acyl-CoA synthetase FdrA [Bacillus sp. S/N-304-OC-R1]
MLHTIIKKNSYQDSINLMLLTNAVATTEGINKVQIMMATPSNKDIYKDAGLYTDELGAAESNDMAIVIDTDDENKVAIVLEKVDQYLKDQSISGKNQEFETVRTWDKAIKTAPNADMALISVPGQYAAEEANKALDLGLHVFLFSDNVSIEDEVQLKKKAREKGLLVMGPDCGTGILDGVPIAFANVVKKGRIGIVGASGTGIQEVSTIIDRLGEGVSHAIGTGGRDLKEPIGAITMMEGIKALENHPQTDIIVVISKPPAKAVRNEVVELLHSLSKPVVTIFIGEKPAQHEGNIYQAYTLAETAQIAVDLARGNAIKEDYNAGDYTVAGVSLTQEQRAIKGLFSGGTMASEAAVLISDALGLGTEIKNEEGYVLRQDGHEVVDLGDDKYTQGKPHPMIDPETRAKFIEQAAQDEKTAVILLDFVLGYGSHEDMASALLPSIQKAVAHAKENGRNLYVVASVCGTLNDPQDYNGHKKRLAEAGIIVKDNNNEAVRTALSIVGLEVNDVKKAHVEAEKSGREFDLTSSEQVSKLVNNKPTIINVGLKSFTEALIANGASVVQYDWRPIAGGNEKMRKILSLLNSYRVEKA